MLNSGLESGKYSSLLAQQMKDIMLKILSHKMAKHGMKGRTMSKAGDQMGPNTGTMS